MNRRNKVIIKHIKIFIIIIVSLIIITLNINNELSRYTWFINIKSNIRFITKCINTLFPILIILIFYITYKILNKKLVFRVEKINLGGVNIIFDDPEKLFKQQVKNFLNTKRTLFKIDNRDNFYETLDSYYSVYTFLREEIKIYDTKISKDSEQYKVANKMMKELNSFLTAHQNNFRRWFKYVMDEKVEEMHDKDIGDIQKEYRHYDKMVNDFANLNNVFCELSSEFDIDVNKWSINNN